VKPIGEYPADAFDRVMAVNVRGVWLGLKYVMKAMDTTGGSIVITSSTSRIRATPNVSAYTASTHAVIA
jgi:NAD(P)-dependent dehydrogenase (short-subunit alcohol dehydrogenase family)